MPSTTRCRFDLLAVLTIGGAALACASGKPSLSSTAGDRSGEAVSADASTDTAAMAKHGALPNASVLGGHGAHAPNTAGVLRGSQSGETSYDASAPATVLVTTRWGHGSGVLIDPRGLVLTNYHVIAAGHAEDFRFHAKVTTVDIQANGSVKPGKQYEAIALKVDPKRDLALLELVAAPTDLPVAPIAQADPKPGRRVAAIGNAGVGFGWAVKHCNINAIGTLESRASATVHLNAEAWSVEEREEMAQVIAKAAKDAGLQIQTDCTILPGDSGGPLIDEQTHELVGLNASVTSAISNYQTIGSVAYHIHVAEIRDFIRDVPTKPATKVPDPWEVAGFDGTLIDGDGDGEFDSMLITGACNESMICHAFFADVDQTSFAKNQPIPTLAQIYEGRAFDAEFVVLHNARLPRGERQRGGRVVPVSDTLLYLDRNNDGTLDSLIVRDGETDEIRGYKGLGSDTIERDPSLDGREQPDAAMFEDPKIGARVERFTDAFERPHYDPRAPTRTRAVEVVFADHDRDGKPDTLYAQTRVDMRVLIDVDQDSIPTFADNAAASEALSAGTVNAEFMAINDTPMRVWYDTDNDGEFDLLLVGTSLDRGVVVDATSYTAAGGARPAPEHLGRRMLRPGLLADPEQAIKLERMFGDAFPQDHADVDDRLSSFPSFTVRPGAVVTEVPNTKNGAVQVVEFDRVMVFADLDRDTFKPKAMKSVSLTEAVETGRFDAEFVFMFDGLMAWTYYDSNGDGQFDVILVSQFGDPLHAEEVYTIRDQLSWSTPSKQTPMFDSTRFSAKKLRTAFKALQQELLEPEAIAQSR